MYRRKKIGVVVPAYNEENNIGKVIETMPLYVDRIIVVDDCSRDNTSQVIEERKQSFKERLVLIRHERRKGVGGAILSGYDLAREEGLELTAVMAGDGQMDPRELSHILDPIIDGKSDYVKGNRLASGEAWEKMPKVRYLGNAMLSLLTKIASGYWRIADFQSGFAAISLDSLHSIQNEKIYRGYGFPNDLLVVLNVHNLRVMDVPTSPRYHVGEKSGIRLWKVVPRLSFLLLRRLLWRLKEKYVIRDFHPLVFFYSLGLLLFPAGSLFGLYLFLFRILYGPVAPTSALFAAFLSISGLQSLFFAMWFDMDYNRGNN
jgi:glycosyltransferase involved in cell wall biosynthesis